MELVGAFLDHERIASWILRCSGAKNVDQLPHGLSQVLTQWVYVGSSSRNDTDDPASSTGPTNVGTSIIRVSYLTSTILDQRMMLNRAATDAYTKTQWATWITIGLGLLTTIVVALSSAEFNGPAGRAGSMLRWFALCLPPIGTAVAAMVAFYSPAEGYGKIHQAVDALGALHREVATISRYECPKTIKESAVADAAAKVAKATESARAAEAAGQKDKAAGAVADALASAVAVAAAAGEVTAPTPLDAKLDLWEDRYSAILDAIGASDASDGKGDSGKPSPGP